MSERPHARPGEPNFPDDLDDLIARVRACARPPEVRERARLLLLDTIGCAVAGLQAPAVRAFVARSARMDPGGVALPVGNTGAAGSVDPQDSWPEGMRLSVPAAAQALAMAACWDEACEGLAVAHGRPGVPVIAATLPLAVSRHVSWKQLLEAVEVGYEIGGRMGAWLRIRPGMHVDAGWPSLGAAAAVAHLLGGTPAQLRDAMEIAGAQLPFGLYLPVAQGADGRNTYLAHAASLGLHSATAALAGVQAPRGAIAMHRELALGCSSAKEVPGASPPDQWPSAPPERWLLREGYLKRWPAVRHVHYGIAAARELRLQMGLSGRLAATNWRRVQLRVYPEAMTYCGNRAPVSPIQAQFSLTFGLAVALLSGELGVESYRTPAFNDAAVRHLEAQIELRADPELGRDGRRCAVLEVEDAAGRQGSARVDKVDGDPNCPMGREAVVDKFARNLREIMSHAEAHGLVLDLFGTGGADMSMGAPASRETLPVSAWWNGLLQARLAA